MAKIENIATENKIEMTFLYKVDFSAIQNHIFTKLIANNIKWLFVSYQVKILINIGIIFSVDVDKEEDRIKISLKQCSEVNI